MKRCPECQKPYMGKFAKCYPCRFAAWTRKREFRERKPSANPRRRNRVKLVPLKNCEGRCDGKTRERVKVEGVEIPLCADCKPLFITEIPYLGVL